MLRVFSVERYSDFLFVIEMKPKSSYEEIDLYTFFINVTR